MEAVKAVSLPCRTVRYGTVRYRTSTGPTLEPRGLAGCTKSRTPQGQSVALYGIVSDRTIRYLPALFIVDQKMEQTKRKRQKERKEKKAKKSNNQKRINITLHCPEPPCCCTPCPIIPPPRAWSGIQCCDNHCYCLDGHCLFPLSLSLSLFLF